MSAPVSSSAFAQMDQVFSRDNASVKAQYGISSRDATDYDAANRHTFNDMLQMSVDCGRVNAAGGRPNVNFHGAACYAPSPDMYKQAVSSDAQYNAFAPADQLILMESDVRYALARFADQNNYAGPTVSDNTGGVPARSAPYTGCETSNFHQASGALSMCSYENFPRPYPNNTDPREAYGVASPSGGFWDALPAAPDFKGCERVGESGNTFCSLNAFTSAGRKPIVGAARLHRQ